MSSSSWSATTHAKRRIALRSQRRPPAAGRAHREHDRERLDEFDARRDEARRRSHREGEDVHRYAPTFNWIDASRMSSPAWSRSSLIVSGTSVRMTLLYGPARRMSRPRSQAVFAIASTSFGAGV